MAGRQLTVATSRLPWSSKAQGFVASVIGSIQKSAVRLAEMNNNPALRAGIGPVRAKKQR